MAPNLLDALCGARAARAEWVAQVESANRAFFEEVDGDPDANFHAMAVRMVEALRGERRAARAGRGVGADGAVGSPSWKLLQGQSPRWSTDRASATM